MGYEGRPDGFSGRGSDQYGCGWSEQVLIDRSINLPFAFAGLHRRLESDDAGVLFLEHSEGMLVVVVDDASALGESWIGNAGANGYRPRE